jgi:hypothetical protein
MNASGTNLISFVGRDFFVGDRIVDTLLDSHTFHLKH